MDRTSLLQIVEPLSHAQRIRVMIDIGRAARTDTQAGQVLRMLAQGDTYERMLALYACYTWQDTETIRNGLNAGSALIRALATSVAVLYLPDDELQVVIPTLGQRHQQRLLVKLAQRNRHTICDRLIADAPLQRRLALLAYCTPELVTRSLDALLPTLGAGEIAALARYHPETTAAALERWMAQPDADMTRVIWLANAALPFLSARLPDAALQLVRSLLPHQPLHATPVQILAYHRPQQVADLLLEHGKMPHVNIPALARSLDAAYVTRLIQQGLLEHPENWLPRLAPDVRRAAYDAGQVAWRDEDGLLDPAVIAALPTTLRHAEARRAVTHPVVRSDAGMMPLYATQLPWEEASPLLQPLIKSPDPADRVGSLAALIKTVRYQPEHMPDALALATTRRNEQDPVRSSMLRAFAELPASRWEPAHLPMLQQIVQDALNAADCSALTGYAIDELVVRLLPFHTEWAAQQYGLLLSQRGWSSRTSLEHHVTPAQVRALAPTVMRVLQAWEPRERTNAILRVAWMFGKRLRDFPELVAMLTRLTHDKLVSNATAALNVLARFVPRTLHQLAPELMQQDQSWIMDYTIANFLHRHRQDLLTPVLGQRPIRGKHATGRTRYVLPFERGFERWTRSQQATFAQVLADGIADAERDLPGAMRMIKQLSQLVYLPPDRLLPLAALDYARPALRDVALRALGRTDSEAAIPLLLGALGDDRSRIAIYALRRKLLALPPAQALPLLSSVPLTRVTVAKETLRLIGDLPGEAAYQQLLTFHQQELHRDVRVALLRAFWSHLEQEATWPILQQAATSDDPAIARGVVAIPAQRISPEARRRLLNLMAQLLRHPNERVRTETLERLAAMPMGDPRQVLGAGIRQGLTSVLSKEVYAASRALFALYRQTSSTAITESVRPIVAQRQNLDVVCTTLHGLVEQHGEWYQSAVRALLVALADDPLTARWRAVLAIWSLPISEIAQLLRSLAQQSLLHADVLGSVCKEIQNEDSYWGKAPTQRGDWQAWEALERELAGDSIAELRRIGLAILLALATQHGWTDERRAALESYRADAAPLVAGTAQFTQIPDKTEEDYGS